MKRLAIPLAIFLSITAFAQETKPQREGAISGRVVADDGQPMSGAQVLALSVGRSRLAGATQTTNCDADGNFKVTGLSSGVYSLVARSPGYVSVQDQSSKYRIGESAIIRMSRGGVITGRVTDEFGEPMVGVRVSADRVRDSEGQPRRSAMLTNGLNSLRMTDDRGVYRIYGLEPGSYVVGINGASSMIPWLGRTGSSSEPPSYHPSSPRGGAVEINLRGSEEVSGIDIRARGGRGRAISGTVSGGASGEGMVNSANVTLLSAADKQVVGITFLTRGENFSFTGVDDGEYELVAKGTNETMDSAASAPRHVAVRGADVNGIELKLMKLGSISGRVVIEAPKAECKTATQFKIEEALVELKRDDKSPGLLALGLFQQTPDTFLGSAEPEKDGSFTVKSLEAGRYRINTDLPDESWYVRAITQAATPRTPKLPTLTDVSRAGVTLKQGEKISGIEIIIAQGAASLGGQVVPASEGAQLPKRLRVHLIPAEEAAADDLLRYAESPVRGDGSFEFKHMAPGKYLLHTRQSMEKGAGEKGAGEKEADDDQARPLAPLAVDAAERLKLRLEASAAKNEIELKPCERVKEHVLRLKP
jgi:hypothetical protein